ncbi:MAG: carbohydrate-binding protein [Epulopiscium sp.]|nr:carbohydrate-binding protein [Candidatus Epulonipiscium sp.]
MKIQIKNSQGEILASKEGNQEISLTYEGVYSEGDKIVFDLENNKHVFVDIGEHVVESLIYAPESHFEYGIPFGEKLTAYHPEAFQGDTHTITMRVADPKEISEYRNLALNGLDKHQEVNYYPHAYANVVTRNEACFEPRNAIDGCKDNSSHGHYPYHSWGGGLRDDLEFTLFFGREVQVDNIVLYLRADYVDDHDTNWETGVFEFSDGSRMPISMIKTAEPQSYSFETKTISWVKLTEIRRPVSSAFAALTQIEVYGAE